MLDMGFIRDVRKIIAQVPAKRQTLLFSATMPADIQSLADNVLRNPVHVAVTPVASTVETIEQSVYFVEKSNKAALLEHLLHDRSMKRVLVFTRTKHGANKLVKQLDKAGMFVEAIHGNKSQSAREQALANFKNGKIHILVATDIAARGLDVEDITHVVNYDLPNEPESYVHRIGRTGRAGASGKAYSFCDRDERAFLVDIERLIRMRIPAAADYPYASDQGVPLPTDLNARGGKKPAQQQAAPPKQRSSQPRQQGSQPKQQGAQPRQQRADQNSQDEPRPQRRRRPRRSAKQSA
jgi:ATP-dependent RNA helicase RhlE